MRWPRAEVQEREAVLNRPHGSITVLIGAFCLARRRKRPRVASCVHCAFAYRARFAGLLRSRNPLCPGEDSNLHGREATRT